MIHTNDLQKRYEDKCEEIRAGGDAKYHEKLKQQNKLFVRDRLALLFDEGEYKEDAMFANNQAKGLPADGVVTAIGKVNGQTVCAWRTIQQLKQGLGEQEQLKRLFVFKKLLKSCRYQCYI